MSKQKTNSRLLSSGAITEEAMLAYLGGALSAADKAQFEQLLADDPFAQDALEGLQSLAQPNSAQNTISDIQTKVRERAGLKEAKTIKLHWATYAWAAAVVGLLVGVGFLMINMLGNKDAALAENKESVPTETTLFDAKESEAKLEQGPLPVDEIAAKAEEPIVDAKDTEIPNFEKAEQGDAKGNSKVVLIDDNNTKLSEQAQGAVAPAKPTVAAAEREEEKVIVSKSRSITLGESKAKMESAAPTMTADGMASAKNKDKKTATVDDAMKEFNSGNYKMAADQFDAVLKSQPENAEALYFGGISEYINGNTKKSEKNFDKLLTDSKGYVEGSKWYKANILLKKGKKEEAKKLLQDLSQTNGSYKERAVKKLAEVQ